MGGNDIAVVEPQVALQRAREFISRVKERASKVRVYTIEQREYESGNRCGITTREYLVRRNRYNRQIKRWLKANGHLHVDIGKPWTVNERKRDGVHFNPEAIRNFKRSIIRVILGVKHAGNS